MEDQNVAVLRKKPHFKFESRLCEADAVEFRSRRLHLAFKLASPLSNPEEHVSREFIRYVRTVFHMVLVLPLKAADSVNLGYGSPQQEQK